MTFKHIKFEDSVVMRSLERIAKQKNPNLPELMKYAAPVINLTPTSSLVENILHLCTGLHQAGLHKYAEEIETNFLYYKQAQTLYETSTEKGEDLIDQAHPKGSHKLEDVDSTEAIFKTIVDKHLDAIKMIEKHPTGKLSEANDIIKAVRIVLADDSARISQKFNDLSKNMEFIFSLHEEENVIMRPMVGGKDVFRALIQKGINNPTIDNVEVLVPRLKVGVTSFYNSFKPGTVFGGSADHIWAGMQPLFAKVNSILSSLSSLVEIRKQQTEEKEEVPPSASDVSPNTNMLKQQATQALNKLDTLSKLVQISQNAKRKAKASQWIDNNKSQIDQIMAAVSSAGWGTPHGEEVATALLPQLTPITDAVEKATFKP